MGILHNLEIPGSHKISSGKVREIFDVDEKHLLIVTTDRISAFDVIMPDPIPEKGAVLNQISLFWFEKTQNLLPNHLVSADLADFPAPFNSQKLLGKRAMLVKKAKPLPIECIVRGYITGSGWKDYLKTGAICGIALPAGLRESDRLPKPIFTPTTKAEIGFHDEAITFDAVCELIGQGVAEKVRDISLKLYSLAAEHARGRGIIIADTKFEFGLIGDEIILIDEVLTPDSSRFWPMDSYEPGKSQPSFDKQFVRDYLETLKDWKKVAPGPDLPAEIIAKTSEKYIEAFERLTGKKFPRD